MTYRGRVLSHRQGKEWDDNSLRDKEAPRSTSLHSTERSWILNLDQQDLIWAVLDTKHDSTSLSMTLPPKTPHVNQQPL